MQKKNRKILLLLIIVVQSALFGESRGQDLRLSKLQYPLIYYGYWSDTDIPTITRFDLAALQAGHYTGKDEKQALQTIREAGTLVFLYISLGEDTTTFNGQPPRKGDGRGPCYYDPDLDMIVYESTGIAGFYLDHWNSEGFLSGDFTNKYSDGLADRHGDWGACYVHAGDPAWQEIVLEEAVRLADFAIDGFFLDTPETPDPWQGYGWTAPGMYSLIQALDKNFPNHLLLLNRGLFFFDPNNPYQYAWNPLEFIDIALFESYRYDSNYTDDNGKYPEYHETPFFLLNKYYTAPKVHASLQQYHKTIPLISIDYTKNPDSFPKNYPEQYAELIKETIQTQGSLELLIDRSLHNISTVILDNPPPPDASAPVWQNSTLGKKGLYENPTFFGVVGYDYISQQEFDNREFHKERVGIQKAVPGNEEVTLYWDVAVDQTGPVSYNVYVSEQLPFSFTDAKVLIDVPYKLSHDYTDRAYIDSDTACPYEYTVTDLKNNTTYYFAVRAEDGNRGAAKPTTGRIGPKGGYEEQNTQILGVVPAVPGTQVKFSKNPTKKTEGLPTSKDIYEKLSSKQFWANIAAVQNPSFYNNSKAVDSASIAALQITDDANYLYIRITATGSIDFYHTALFLNTDAKSYTGHAKYGGADYRFLGGVLSAFTWDWDALREAEVLYEVTGDSMSLAIRKCDLKALCNGLLSLGASILKPPMEKSSDSPELFHGIWYHQKNTVSDCIPPVFQRNELLAKAGPFENSVYLEWAQAFDDQSSTRYEIRDGKTHELLVSRLGIPYSGLKATKIIIPGLDSSQRQFLAVYAVDDSGNYTTLNPVSVYPSKEPTEVSWVNDSGTLEAVPGMRNVSLYFNRAAKGSIPASYSLDMISEGQSGKNSVSWEIDELLSDNPDFDYMYTVKDLEGFKEYTFTLKGIGPEGMITANNPQVTVSPLGDKEVSISSMNGYFEDWHMDSQVALVGRDRDDPLFIDDKILDIDALWYRKGADGIFFRLALHNAANELDGNISFFLDVDNNKNTGFNGKIGIDYLVTGNGSLYALADGREWDAAYIGSVPVSLGKLDPSSLEMGLPSEIIPKVSASAKLYVESGSEQHGYGKFDILGPLSLNEAENESSVFKILVVTLILFGILLVVLNLLIKSDWGRSY